MEGRIGEVKKERREGRKGTGKEWDIASALNALFPFSWESPRCNVIPVTEVALFRNRPFPSSGLSSAMDLSVRTVSIRFLLCHGTRCSL